MLMAKPGDRKILSTKRIKKVSWERFFGRAWKLVYPSVTHILVLMEVASFPVLDVDSIWNTWISTRWICENSPRWLRQDFFHLWMLDLGGSPWSQGIVEKKHIGSYFNTYECRMHGILNSFDLFFVNYF